MSQNLSVAFGAPPGDLERARVQHRDHVRLLDPIQAGDRSAVEAMLAAIVIGWVVLVLIYVSSFATAGSRRSRPQSPLHLPHTVLGACTWPAGSLWKP
jgi:hypothetical protein